MAHSNERLVLVVCNDYGELAFALYLLAGQPFAQHTTLMLPPHLYAKNPDALPGRTFLYNSLDDVQKEMDGQSPGILGLFSGYLLPIHRLCDINELNALLRFTQVQEWKCFTSDPFLGLLNEVEASELMTLKVPKLPAIWSLFTVAKEARLAAEAQVSHSKVLLTQTHSMLKSLLHVYPCGESSPETISSVGERLHFHNPAYLPQPKDDSPKAAIEPTRWLFVLSDQDYDVQEQKYGRAVSQTDISRKFRKILLRKLHETLEAGRVPILVAPAKVIAAVREHSPAADAMELLPHCEYSHFQSMLKGAEYVFYWNAVSFSCIIRILTDKPWFTFDDGHLLKGLNADYASRISDWFYRDYAPPRLNIKSTLTCDALLQASERYTKLAWPVRQRLLDSPEPQDLFTVLD